MNKLFLSILFLYISFSLKGQPNCNVFLWEGDTLKYEACKLSENFKYFYQFDTRAIEILDSCITICPYYAFPYYEKAVPYLKAGNPMVWDKYINLAVKYDATTYLGTRASCRGKFFADYEGAIKDIDSLDMIVDYDIGYTHDGTYHLTVYKGLCYKAMGEYSKAIEVIVTFLDENPSDIGFYDYLHLGVAHQAVNQHKQALESFKKQEAINDIAENHYYSALSYKQLGDLKNFWSSISKAKEKIANEQKMSNKYHVLEDEVFMTDIKRLMKSMHNK